MYVNNQNKLEELCDRLRPVTRLAFDTEFVGEKSYTPLLEIIQVAAPGVEAIIDYRAVRDLDCFVELLVDPAIEKVVHAGSQDLEIFFRLAGQVPAPIFDTQVAAAMLGYGAQPGYAFLVERLAGARLNKSQTMTDWSRRPLTPAQIDYALDDVRYLLPMRERLGQELEAMGRAAWVEDEFARMSAAESYERPDPTELWQRVKGASGLSGRQLAILRELATWREKEARERDRPRGSILRDDLLVAIARKAPTTTAELKELRGVYPRELERYGAALIGAVRRGQQTPRDQLPQFAKGAALSGPEAALVEVLQGLLRARADESRIAPALIATNSDLYALVETRGQGRGAALPLLHGWRYDVAGADLLRVVRGQADVGWDPQTQRLVLVERQRASGKEV